MLHWEPFPSVHPSPAPPPATPFLGRGLPLPFPAVHSRPGILDKWPK